MTRCEVAITVFGLLNAILCTLLMPLWDGFGEPFHYGYAQWLGTGGGLPVLGKTPISAELLWSLEQALASHIGRRNLPFVITFREYAALPDSARAERRAQREQIPV